MARARKKGQPNRPLKRESLAHPKLVAHVYRFVANLFLMTIVIRNSIIIIIIILIIVMIFFL